MVKEGAIRERVPIAILVAAVAVLLLAIVVLGQGADDGPWHSVDGGGGVSQGNTFTVRGTAGQPDAGVSSGVTYTVRGGFWGIATAGHTVYLPVVLRGH